jgi:FlaA1/EpsC-like NDP-sugar epimerase
VIRPQARLDWREFLARPPLPPPSAEILDGLAGTAVLITGAGGSIGSALALRLAQMAAHRPGVRGRSRGHRVLVEASESNLSSLEQAWREETNSYEGQGASASFHLADAGDRAGLEEIFSAHAPRLVFHAAAYKHVPMLEERPLAAISNNIFATEVVAAAARAHGARVILLSTDKAVLPVSVMGATKRVAEKIVLAQGGTVLRMGNVLDSSGSVTEVFAKQIADGSPLTVTDPAARRFFLTMNEAVNLLLLAAAPTARGVLLAPAQLAEYSIVELARFMAHALAPGREIPIIYTGLRPGEKHAERLWDDSERARPWENCGVYSIASDAPDAAEFEDDLGRLRAALDQRDLPAALRGLCALVPGYQPTPAALARAGMDSRFACV